MGARIAHLKSQLCSVRLWCMCWKMVFFFPPLFFFLFFFLFSSSSSFLISCVITAWQSEFWSSFWKLVGLASNSSPWLSWFCADCAADISPCQHAHLFWVFFYVFIQTSTTGVTTEHLVLVSQWLVLYHLHCCREYLKDQATNQWTKLIFICIYVYFHAISLVLPV